MLKAPSGDQIVPFTDVGGLTRNSLQVTLDDYGIRAELTTSARVGHAGIYVGRGRFISTTNGLGALYPTWIGVPDSSIGVLTNTLDEMRTDNQAMRALALLGLPSSSGRWQLQRWDRAEVIDRGREQQL